MPSNKDKTTVNANKDGTGSRVFCYENTAASDAHLRVTYPSDRPFKGVRYCVKNNRKFPYEAWAQFYPNGPDGEQVNQFLGRCERPHDAANLYDQFARKNPKLGLKTNFGDR